MFAVIYLGIFVLMLVAQGRLLSKSGENGWKILIPVYGSYKLYSAVEAGELFIANMVLSVISSVAITAGAEVVGLIGLIILMIVSIFFNIKLANAYGKSGGFAVGLIFLPVIFLCILAFGSAEHVGYAAAWKYRSEQQNSWKCPNCGAA